MKFSSNWKKQKQRITRLYHQIGNAWNHFLHKTSTTLNKNHAMIVIDDLNVMDSGGELLAVNPDYTSQICSVCGHVSADNRVTQ